MIKDEVKYCLRHGSLTAENVIVEPRKEMSDYLRCKYCKLEKDRRWKINNWEQHKEASRRYKRSNKGKYSEWHKKDYQGDKEKYKKWSKEYKGRNREKVRIQEICRIHNLTIEQYEEMKNKTNNTCYICSKEETTRGRGGDIMPLCVDHCHKSQEKGIYKIRGLLCRNCNQGLGHFKDNIEFLKKASEYLKLYE